MKNATRTLEQRASGILLHPSSLPGPHGIGDLGPAALDFADFLARAGQSWWQMLPVDPPGGGGQSPYYALSAFAGNPLLVSLDGLVQDGLLGREDLAPAAPIPADRTRFGEAIAFKLPKLKKAFQRFSAAEPPAMREQFDGFRAAHAGWLPDFALFCAVKDRHEGRAWCDWSPDLRARIPSALAEARTRLAAEIRFHEFVQFQFWTQWGRLQDHCRKLGIGLIGDLPIFVAHDSADVWSNPELFHLDEKGRPTVVAGVPPDYFSATGQLWGNPLYCWERLRDRGFDWWLARLRWKFARFDAVRLDHFIGFHRCWEIPADAKTAETGRWAPVPGAQLFEALLRAQGKVEIIAEDLGLLIPEVEQLRDRFGFPGMKILQFSFGGEIEDDLERPHRYARRCAVYTGTHDNDTVVGWFRDAGRGAAPRRLEEIDTERRTAQLYIAGEEREIHWDMIRMAYLSVPNLAVVPMQDVLGLGSEARMNTPGTRDGNWEWRLAAGDLTPMLAERLRLLARLYGRAPVQP